MILSWALIFFSGKPTPVRVNILIRSMGPISEANMVNVVIKLVYKNIPENHLTNYVIINI